MRHIVQSAFRLDDLHQRRGRAGQTGSGCGVNRKQEVERTVINTENEKLAISWDLNHRPLNGVRLHAALITVIQDVAFGRRWQNDYFKTFVFFFFVSCEIVEKNVGISLAC